MKDGQPIYLDYQSTTPVDPYVYAQMEPFFSRVFGNPHSVEHAAGWDAARAIDKAALRIGNLIGADPDEIIFCSGATEANNLAILGTARKQKTRKRILVSAIEHKCIFEAARSLARIDGFRVETIPVNAFGEIDLAWLSDTIDDDVLLVSVMAVNNEIGTIQPLHKIGKITSTHGVIFHCDAAQAPCSSTIDVFNCNIDLLSLSGHKFYGPKGIGSLYIRRELQHKIEPIIYGGGQQNGIRAGTLPVPLCVGLGAAAEMLSAAKVNEERKKISGMRDRFIEKVQKSCRCVELNGPPPSLRHPGNANLWFRGYNAQNILATLQPQLLASTGSACTSGLPDSSHVLRAVGLSEEAATSSIRFSIGRFTTEKELADTAELLREALALLGCN